MKKKKAFVHFIFLVYLPVGLFSQQPIIEWERTYGGSDEERSGSIVQCAEGGFLMAINSESTDGDFDQNYGDSDLWLFKINEEGHIKWRRNYGGSGRDSAPYIYALSDGSFLLLGDTDSDDGDIPTNKGWSDGWVVKVNSEGEVVWSRTYGGSNPDFFQGMVELNDGGLLLSGSTYSGDGDIGQNRGEYDVWIVRLDSFGELEWSKTYGGSGPEGGEIYGLNSGNFLVTAYSDSNDGDVLGNAGGTDAWVFEIDEDGNIIRSRTYGGSRDESLRLAIESIDGNLIFCGSTSSNNGVINGFQGKRDYWILKTTSSGNVLMSKNYGGSEWDGGCLPLLLPNENIILVGTSFSNDGQVSDNYGDISLTDIWLIEVDQNGNLIWEKNYGGSQPDIPMRILEFEDGFLLLSTSESSDYDVSENEGGKDIWLAKFLFPPSEEERRCDFKISPNPVLSGNLKLDFEVPMVGDFQVAIYDVTGRLAHMEAVDNKIAKESTIEVQSNLASGLYIFQVAGNGHRCTERLVLAK